MFVYKVESRKIDAWGGYGSYLVNASGAMEEDGLHIDRSGPFVPPIYKTASVIVNDEYKEKLQNASPYPVIFEAVIYDNIYKLNWHEWDFQKSPEFIPQSGEPDDYWRVCPKVSVAEKSRMPPSWKINPTEIDQLRYSQGSVYVSEDAWDEIEMKGIVTNETKFLFVITEEVKKLWTGLFGDWVNFVSLPVVFE